VVTPNRLHGLSQACCCPSPGASNSFWTQVWQGTCPITSQPNGICAVKKRVVKKRSAFAGCHIKS
jgi:hypothetical protein